MSYPVATLLSLTFLATSAGVTSSLAVSNDDEASQRYSFQTIAGGTLRMDRQSGIVELCDKQGADWVCSDLKELQNAQDQQAALLDEITRLANLNAMQSKQMQDLRQQLDSLSQRLAKLESHPSDEAMQPKSPNAQQLPKTPVPVEPDKGLTEQDEEGAHFEEFLDRSERLFRHFFGLVKEFKRDLADERA
ncbi:hypothetical protein [Cohaesibacter gelatinilyticus]|uniref:LTXXQ motif family protein n=1 Tax=Cohaesibacter gelatinilyticus TaxID=372072 RepID=A0A285N6J7_9HYPH|nr:hypothetical protein [Cohaesibacter gelatinilyticus]SNZ05049.1 hypothetical protein SAMN06265368_0019 [Cohaesibacter gelatinilyticus]